MINNKKSNLAAGNALYGRAGIGTAGSKEKQYFLYFIRTKKFKKTMTVAQYKG